MPNRKYHVTISERATAMLLNHVRFLANVSPDAASRLHKEMARQGL